MKIRPDDVASYGKFGYGKWRYGPGLRYERRRDLLAATHAVPAAARREMLLRFFTISDVHISDKESPSSAIQGNRVGDIFTEADGVNRREYYMGALDGATPYGNVISAGPVGNFIRPQKVVADATRRSLRRSEWMREFLDTTSSPAGHGFTQVNVDDDFACYSFHPRSDMPLKVIVLDDTQRDEDINPPHTAASSSGHGHGSIDEKRYNWLVKELTDGQAAGELMIIAAHIPIGVEPPTSFVGWNSAAYVSEETMMATLHKCLNLIMLIAGHRHCNAVTAFRSSDAARPERGFWQVETASLRDFPQQFRQFDVVDNGDNTISILAVNVDTAVRDGSLAATSRSYAIAAPQIYGFNKPAQTQSPLQPTGSYNAELVVQITPEMQTRLRHRAVSKRG